MAVLTTAGVKNGAPIRYIVHAWYNYNYLKFKYETKISVFFPSATEWINLINILFSKKRVRNYKTKKQNWTRPWNILDVFKSKAVACQVSMIHSVQDKQIINYSK